jgi:hypothetical protein
MLGAASTNSECQMIPELSIRKTSGARVVQINETWRLEIPPGEKGVYRVAQLDDYGSLSRRSFNWSPPFWLSLRARASSDHIPGTWGFGLWNNPFGMALFSGVEILRLPALPNTAWFFFASQHNYLSLRDDLPAHGGMAATFRSAPLPAPFLLPAVPVIPLLLVPPAARQLRRLARLFVRQDAAALNLDPTQWQQYEISWFADRVLFLVNGQVALQTAVSPRAPLSLVLWVDNQFAAFLPDGKTAVGTLPTPEPAWIELDEIEVAKKSLASQQFSI